MFKIIVLLFKTPTTMIMSNFKNVVGNLCYQKFILYCLSKCNEIIATRSTCICCICYLSYMKLMPPEVYVVLLIKVLWNYCHQKYMLYCLSKCYEIIATKSICWIAYQSAMKLLPPKVYVILLIKVLWNYCYQKYM